MLRELHIRDFALIDDISLTFAPGLSILTGETGAGKSIIIDALGFVLGERVNVGDIVRTGADRATVEAVFEIDNSPDSLREKLRDFGLDDDDALFLQREAVAGAGKSQCRINGRLAPVSVLKEIGDSLVDVHGQHEHQSLLVADRHLDILDAWCGAGVLELRARLASQFSRLLATTRDLDQLRSDSRDRARMLDVYRYQSAEISAANLVPGEEQQLEADRLRLANASRLATAAEGARSHLSDDDRRGAIDLLNAALAAVGPVAELDETLAPIMDTLRESAAFAEDAARDLRRYQDGIEFDPKRLEEIQSRQETINGLKRKYGSTVDEVLSYLADLDDQLQRLENSDAHEARLQSELGKIQQEATALASQLTRMRSDAASRFAAGIAEQLSDLGMSAARFDAVLNPQPLSARGAERIEFLISANPGEPLKPLARIASGGEMSRVMLAIKSVMAGTSGIPTMIFDEIDAGVGGRTANVLGDKLAGLAANAQILCITHLPQIAARAGTHFSIEKTVVLDRTVVSARALTTHERVDEIVRMLGGASPSEAAVRHAREMLMMSG